MQFNIKNREKGSALLIVMMMVLMLTILILEISFTAQTAYSLAKNQIEKAKMNEVAESGFAYAINIVQVKSETDGPVVSAGIPSLSNVKASTTPTNNTETGTSIFAKSNSADNSAPPGTTSNTPPWKQDFPVVSIGGINMKLKISLEESKININRLVNSEDKVDIRIRSALIDIFKKFEGTEEDVDRIIDYIDLNTLGQYETDALNGPAQSIGEILAIPNITVKYSLEDKKEGVDNTVIASQPVTTLNSSQETDSLAEKPPTLSDFITVKSTGRININYASEDVLKSIINGQQERVILETILQSRATAPFKTLNQLAFNKTFASTYKKMANYLTIDEKTFKVKVILKSTESFKSRIFYGYIYNFTGKPQYVLRTERIGGNDKEFIYDDLEMEDVVDESKPESDDATKSDDKSSTKTDTKAATKSKE